MSTKTNDAACDLIIYHTGPTFKIPSSSDFCLKLETYFRMANLQYKLEVTTRSSSKGKVPFITHKDKELADSTFIIEYLNKEMNVDLNSNLSPAEKGIAQAFKRLCEENLYWVQTYHRIFVDFDGFLKTLPIKGFKKKMLPVYLALKVKPNAKANLNGHGIGRHTKEEITEIGKKDLTAISDFLGEKTFLMGDQVSEVDASIFGIVAQSVYGFPGSELEAFVKESLPSLVAYCDRMKEKYWPDWDECCLVEQKDEQNTEETAKEVTVQEPAAGEVNGDAKEEQTDDTPKENGVGDEEQAAASEEQKPGEVQGEVQAEAQNGESGDAQVDEQQKATEAGSEQTEQTNEAT